jgi:hypothetical protein
MADYNWNNIDDVYLPLDKGTKKDDFLEFEIVTIESIDEINAHLIKSLIRDWTFPSNGKYVKPFRLLEVYDNPNLIRAKVQLKKKVDDVDELRLFCQDILDILNTDHIHVSKFSVKDCS